MTFWTSGSTTYLLVTNAYDDTISVINTNTNTVSSTIELDPFLAGLGVKVPDKLVTVVGPNSITVDNSNNAYVALYNANAVAVIDLNTSVVSGLIPVGYAPSSVVFDSTDGELLVANDKGLGTDGYGVAPPPTNTFENSYAKEFTVFDFETHQDLGTVSIIPIASLNLSALTTQVIYNNHWDLTANIESASGGSPKVAPVAIPAKIGSPSLIKHVFLIIRENRTYDQILGDVTAGNGDASLAVFGDNSPLAGNATYDPAGYTVITPNAHALVQRFPLLDNFYDPSRQSADGHNWITQALAPYSDDIQSPDWLRDYPSNGGDALAYQKAGHLWDQAAKDKVSFKNYGEYIEYNSFLQPNGSTAEPLWIDFYNDITCYEAGNEPQLYNYNTVASHSPLPNLMNATYQTYPQFDLGIPDQFRFDIWNEDFQSDVAAGYGAPVGVHVDQLRPHRRPAASDSHAGRQRPGPWPLCRRHQPQLDLVLFGDLRRGRRRADRRRPRRWSPQPWLCRQPLRHPEYRWYDLRRQHLLHASQPDPHDRADSRHPAHEPVRSRGLADEHALPR